MLDDRSKRPALAVVGAAGVAHCVPALAAVLPLAARRTGVETHVGDARGVALTFDDGPHRDGTPAVLEALRAAERSATFFLVGEQVRRMPSLVAEIVAAGHEVGVHGDRHRNLLRLAPSQVEADLARAQATIADAAGRPPGLYRPPYGIFSWRALAVARRERWVPLLWSRWGRDWQSGATAASICRRLVAKVEAGDVLLLHDADHYSASGSWRRTAAALPMVIEELELRGLASVLPGRGRSRERNPVAAQRV